VAAPGILSWGGPLVAFENLVGPKKVPIRDLFPIHRLNIR